VDRDTPTLPLKLRLLKGKVTLARDLAGDSLHKRGWRPIQVKSPLNEAVAAGLLLAAGYDGTGLLADPMCGGATFLVEAAWIAQDRAPGLDRGFAFTAWPDVDKAVWHELVGEALDRQKRDVDARFEGADHHAGAVALARRGVHDADVQHLVRVAEADAASWKPSADPQWLFTNPPWGERLSEDVELSWRGLAKALRNCPGVAAHVLCGNPELTKILGMRSDRRWPLKTGPVDAMLLRYQVRARSETR
jgi:putative N6-adenine-specific DNA methylase